MRSTKLPANKERDQLLFQQKLRVTRREQLLFEDSTYMKGPTSSNLFFCWRLLGLIPGGAPFSQLSSGVKNAMVLFTMWLKCHFMTILSQKHAKAVETNTKQKESKTGTVHTKCQDCRRGLRRYPKDNPYAREEAPT